MKRVCLPFFGAFAIVTLALGIPSGSQAATTTIANVSVTIGGTPSSPVWTPQALTGGQTLVLTQNAATTSSALTANYDFDISDSTCPGGCAPAVVSFTADGVTYSMTDSTQALTLKNGDPDNPSFNEGQTYTKLGTITTVGGLNVTVYVGYADNAHTNACGSDASSLGLPGSSTCFPTPFNGNYTTAAATFFQGIPQLLPATEPTDSSGHNSCSKTTADCWDAGVIAFSVAQSTPVVHGDTATIGFWHNKNGQALIDSLNGGSSQTALATWLATNFPYLYGASSPASSPCSVNLTGETNADVAAQFMTFFNVQGQKTCAQILGTALAVYVTDSALAGTAATKYGFNVSPSGIGGNTYNVGSDGTAIGLSNDTSYSVLQLLQQANLDIQNGTFDANAFNDIFDGINQTGDIS